MQANGDVITLAACGDAHSVLLATGGAVYTAGCNKHGQCAQGVELQMVSDCCTQLPIAASHAVFCRYGCNPDAGVPSHVGCCLSCCLQCTVFCQPLQPLGAAAAVACGVANTAVATVTGKGVAGLQSHAHQPSTC